MTDKRQIGPAVQAALAQAGADLRQRAAIHKAASEADGASAGSSALGAVVYVVPDPPKVCDGCGRGPKFYNGCSLVECPQRGRVRVRPWGKP